MTFAGGCPLRWVSSRCAGGGDRGDDDPRGPHERLHRPGGRHPHVHIQSVEARVSVNYQGEVSSHEKKKQASHECGLCSCWYACRSRLARPVGQRDCRCVPLREPHHGRDCPALPPATALSPLAAHCSVLCQCRCCVEWSLNSLNNGFGTPAKGTIWPFTEFFFPTKLHYYRS